MDKTYYTIVKRLFHWEGGELLGPGSCSTTPLFAYTGRKQQVIEQIEQRWPGAILVEQQDLINEQLHRFQQLGPA